jgi:peptidoglycan/LPS O-acetylase OafA/YrhL
LLVELSFYLLVLLVLLFGLRRHLDTLFLAWPIGMLLASLAASSYLPFLGGYYPFFAAGALFALSRQRSSAVVVAGLAACLWLCVSGAIQRADHASRINGTEYSDLVIAAVIGLQFGFFALLNTRRGQSVALPGSRLAGNLTYPIYLLHAHVGYMLLSRFATDANQWFTMPLVVMVILAASYAIHVLVERRLAGFWTRLFNKALGRPLDSLFFFCTRRLGAHAAPLQRGVRDR